MIDIQETVARLNARERDDRMEAARALKAALDRGDIPAVRRLGECDNHIHSQFSFSPYSPAMIAWKAYQAGLDTCGIVDHESVAGCLEFREACALFGIAPTIGFEIRLNWDGTPLEGKKFNNPDQLSVGYFPIHGVPVRSLEAIEQFLRPIRRAREARNRLMTRRICQVLAPHGMELDFDRDVVPVSRWQQGGSITERHLLYATALKLIGHCGRGEKLLRFMADGLKIAVPEKSRGYLLDADSPIYAFDLTNVLKGYFSELMYVDATHEETPAVAEVIPFLSGLGCVATYTYLGDVRQSSVTGDKKTQKFEDDILDEMFECLYAYGLRGFSYAPTRNDADQVARVRALCRRYGMLEICGEDINQPRQSFICQQKNDADRRFFNDSTWALIGHEYLADRDLSQSIVSPQTEARLPDLDARIKSYKRVAQELHGTNEM